MLFAKDRGSERKTQVFPDMILLLLLPGGLLTVNIALFTYFKLTHLVAEFVIDPVKVSEVLMVVVHPLPYVVLRDALPMHFFARHLGFLEISNPMRKLFKQFCV